MYLVTDQGHFKRTSLLIVEMRGEKQLHFLADARGELVSEPRKSQPSRTRTRVEWCKRGRVREDWTTAAIDGQDLIDKLCHHVQETGD
jgi:hypothetical protein